MFEGVPTLFQGAHREIPPCFLPFFPVISQIFSDFLIFLDFPKFLRISIIFTSFAVFLKKFKEI